MTAETHDRDFKTAVIGAGFAGLSAAAYLSAAGLSVDVFEKNEQTGGRARQLLTDNGYRFDMGPSWYWMPDVFQKFFHDFGSSAEQWYELTRLDPAFRVVFGPDEVLDIPAGYTALRELFDSLEKGGADRLDQFLDQAEYKYRVGMDKLVYKPGLSLWEFADKDLLKGVFRLQVFTSFSKHVRKYFWHPKLIALMEFPVLFLGAAPEDTPALYSLMNYAGLKLGTWYPKGGFGTVTEAMKRIAADQGTRFFTGEAVDEITIEHRLATGIISGNKKGDYDGVIAAVDYHHVESRLIRQGSRNYDEPYWEKRVMAPSALVFYLGVTRKVERLLHHTLFFDRDLQQHAHEIYKHPEWPSNPLFYVCCPSKTDDGVAPEGHENIFILVPLAPGLKDDEEVRERYYHAILERLENFTGVPIRSALDYKKSFCISDFTADYNAYKGNAYGLANTLNQTAHLKPSIRNKAVHNLFYAGQLTVPGPGVPPAIISGKIAAAQLINYLKERK